MFQHRLAHYLILIGVASLLFLPNLGGPSLWDIDEGKNGECAREMLESGNLVVPTFNGELRSDKPVLLYWLQVAACAAFGVSEFAVRLPSAIASLLTVLLTYELGRRMFHAATGLLAGLILASTLLFCAAGHFANPDALLCAFTLANLFCFYVGLERTGRPMFISVGISAGLAVLAKGPVGLVLPTLICGLFLAWSGRLRSLLDRRIGLMLLFFLLVSAPWYVWVAIDTKFQFWREFFLTHNRDRALSPMENHSGPPFYYLLVLLVGFAPWSIFLGAAFWYGVLSAVKLPWAFARSAWENATEDKPRVEPHRFLLCWIIAYVAVFSLAATKLPNYILPIYPAVALLTAGFLDRWRRGAVEPRPWLIHASLASLALIGLATGLGLLVASGTLSLAFLRGRVFPGLETWAFLGAAPVLGALVAWWQLQQQARDRLVWCVALTAVVFLAPLAAWGASAFNDHKAPRELVRDARLNVTDRPIRIGCYQLEHLPSLNFYVGREVRHVLDDDQAVTFLATPDHAADVQPLPAYLLLPASTWERLKGRMSEPTRVVARHRDFYRNGEVVVVTTFVDARWGLASATFFR